MTEAEQAGIAEMVEMDASLIFDECGAADDFCLQNVGGAVVVFGGVNRVLWTPIRGFTLDSSFCTREFIKRFHIWRDRDQG